MAEGFGRGLKVAIFGLAFGFVLSVLVSVFAVSTMGESGRSIVTLINFSSILIGIIQFERAKYWGLLYLSGYFVGLYFVGKYLMEPWEQAASLLILGFYFAQKFVRKIRKNY